MLGNIIFTVREHVAFITLNRPEISNLITSEMAGDIELACRQVIEDKDINTVVLSANGPIFSIGGDDPTVRVADAVASIDRPVIAAINGDSLGQGLELCLACDIRMAAQQARLGMDQVTKGNFPYDGATQRLPRIVGKAKALEMMLTGGILTAAEAHEIGLVNEIFPPEDLISEVTGLAISLSVKGPIALRYLKEAVLKGLDMTLEQGLRLEGDLYFLLQTTTDRTEGIRAFQQKRRPDFKGK